MIDILVVSVQIFGLLVLAILSLVLFGTQLSRFPTVGGDGMGISDVVESFHRCGQTRMYGQTGVPSGIFFLIPKIRSYSSIEKPNRR
jgi:hypothetical protein